MPEIRRDHSALPTSVFRGNRAHDSTRYEMIRLHPFFRVTSEPVPAFRKIVGKFPKVSDHHGRRYKEDNISAAQGDKISDNQTALPWQHAARNNE